jgi:hypothetical protein
LQVPERAQVPSPRRREDPLPQPSYVVLRRAPVNGVPHQDIVRRSVHREVSNLPSDSDGIDQHPLHSSPAHVSAPFGARAPWLGIRPVTQQRPPGGAATSLRFPVGFRPPAFASWASCSRQRIPPSLTVGLPHRHSGPDSVGVPAFRTCEKRPGWVPSLLRGGGVVPATETSMTGACRFSTASPLPPLQHPIGEGWDHEAYEDSLTFTRPAFPSPVVPGWNGNPSASSPGFAPHGHP